MGSTEHLSNMSVSLSILSWGSSPAWDLPCKGLGKAVATGAERREPGGRAPREKLILVGG